MDKLCVYCFCGYGYDPANGDPGRNIAPGTRFEGLPVDWTCPVCEATKDQFEKQQIFKNAVRF